MSELERIDKEKEDDENSFSVYNDKELEYLDKYLPLVTNIYDENELYDIIIENDFRDQKILEVIEERKRYINSKGDDYTWKVVKTVKEKEKFQPSYKGNNKNTKKENYNYDQNYYYQENEVKTYTKKNRKEKYKKNYEEPAIDNTEYTENQNVNDYYNNNYSYDYYNYYSDKKVKNYNKNKQYYYNDKYYDQSYYQTSNYYDKNNNYQYDYTYDKNYQYQNKYPNYNNQTKNTKKRKFRKNKNTNTVEIDISAQKIQPIQEIKEEINEIPEITNDTKKVEEATSLEKKLNELGIQQIPEENVNHKVIENTEKSTQIIIENNRGNDQVPQIERNENRKDSLSNVKEVSIDQINKKSTQDLKAYFERLMTSLKIYNNNKNAININDAKISENNSVNRDKTINLRKQSDPKFQNNKANNRSNLNFVSENFELSSKSHSKVTFLDYVQKDKNTVKLSFSILSTNNNKQEIPKFSKTETTKIQNENVPQAKKDQTEEEKDYYNNKFSKFSSYQNNPYAYFHQTNVNERNPKAAEAINNEIPFGYPPMFMNYPYYIQGLNYPPNSLFENYGINPSQMNPMFYPNISNFANIPPQESINNQQFYQFYKK